MIEDVKKDAAKRMKKSVESLVQELSKIRTGRAHASLLDHITVAYYGADVPLNQAASVVTEDARTLSITPWDKGMVQSIEKAIMSSGLGLNPSTAGLVIRVVMPALTEERRRDLVKVVRNEAEAARVAIRNIRRDANQDLKDMVKEKMISEDDERRGEQDIQKLTDAHVVEVESLLESKEKEMLVL